jgi:sugar O-acyltransferase (sialic acid O-acetyltransferase NeuD family)
MRVIIVGAGGHGQVVADILGQMQTVTGDVSPLGYVDENPALSGLCFLGLPVLGQTSALPLIAHEAIVIAIGDNQTRQRLFQTWQSQGEQFIVARHPRAVIAPDVPIGAGSVVCAGAIINPGATIGANVILNSGCTVDHHNHIGDHVHIAPGVHLGGEVVIGEGTLIGIGATIMPGRQVGPWSVVGAGALVHRDLPGGVTAVGVPANIIGNCR